MLMYKYEKNLKIFLLWGFLCIIANILCTFANSYDGDQGYWVGWIQQLMDNGFGEFSGNYPPLYVIWLWIVAQVHSILGITASKVLFVKFICLWPIYFSHLFLVDWLCRFSGKIRLPHWEQHLLIGFVALNPAILLDGPIWGQVDIFPVIFAMISIYCMCRKKLVKFGSLFFILSVLTKFQMIMFLPIFGGLFLKNWRTSWKGLPFAILGTLLVLLPFIITGNLAPMLSRAYIQTTSQYPYATYNAANLWMFLVGNVSPDNVPLGGLSSPILSSLLKPAVLGKILFTAVSVFTLIKSIRCKSVRTAYALCVLNAVTFFVVLPGMHERYLMYAIPAALCWFIWDTKRAGIFCVIITLIAAININLINTFKGSDVWQITSVMACIVFLVLIIAIAMPNILSHFTRKISRWNIPAYVPYVMLSLILLTEGGLLLSQMRPITIDINEKNILITDLSIIQQRQNYKSPQINESVEGHFLTIEKQNFKYGIGAHAPSSITYELPADADSLFWGAGIDDECQEHGSAIFIVKLDDNEVWRSRLLQWRDKAEFEGISVNGAKYLELITDPHGDNNCDHTDWLNVYVKLK